MECKTVKVKADNEQGFKLINEEDFVEGEHELFIEGKEVEMDGEPGEGEQVNGKTVEGEDPAPVAIAAPIEDMPTYTPSKKKASKKSWE